MLHIETIVRPNDTEQTFIYISPQQRDMRALNTASTSNRILTFHLVGYKDTLACIFMLHSVFAEPIENRILDIVEIAQIIYNLSFR